MSTPGLKLRLATEADGPLLFEIYATSRDDDPALRRCDSEYRRQRLETEFASRQRSYRVDFPGIEYFVILAGDQPVGRIYVQDAPTVIFVVDLILLPAWRGMGCGTSLLRSVLAQGATTRRPVRLHVEKNNSRAFMLYERLGFRIIGGMETHHLMEGPAP